MKAPTSGSTLEAGAFSFCLKIILFRKIPS
nr:MAG TPA: hypothetical protein [Caudoviricetes sp.]